MKFCVAQTKPIRGAIQENLENHIKFIETAVAHQADLIIFPELSLTGYEPTLAKQLATEQDDKRLDLFQKISDTQQITIGVGIPTKNGTGVVISMVLFQAYKPRQIYSKKYLHMDEEPFFNSGENFPVLKVDEANIALAICYELSVPAHVATAVANRADIYIASVAKSESGVEKAAASLSEIAKRYSIPVMMSNCVGQSDDFVSAGKTSVWNRAGLLLGQLDSLNTGMIIYDSVNQTCNIQMV